MRNLNGKTLTATSFDFPPYNFPVKDGDGNVIGQGLLYYLPGNSNDFYLQMPIVEKL